MPQMVQKRVEKFNPMIEIRRVRRERKKGVLPPLIERAAISDVQVVLGRALEWEDSAPLSAWINTANLPEVASVLAQVTGIQIPPGELASHVLRAQDLVDYVVALRTWEAMAERR